ncbi:hypothetical protein E4U45_007123 [Claviceps purpurea]|nr:hypothetical protein E4U45_007123 [Claviceps purpurea]
MASRRRIPKVAIRHKLHTTRPPTAQAWWPEGSDPGGANVGVPPNQVESSGEGERLSRKRKRSSSSPSGELRGDDQKKTASHDAQLQRLKNAQASKRSRTRLNTMKVLPVEWYTLFLYLLCGLLCVILLVIAPKLSR